MPEQQEAEHRRRGRTCVIRTLGSWIEGSVLVGALEDEGIPATLESMEDRAYDGIFTLAQGAARLWVFEEDRQRAESVIEQYLKWQSEQEPDQKEEQE